MTTTHEAAARRAEGDPNTYGLAQQARGLLREFNARGVIAPADVHVATRVAARAGEEREALTLLVALIVRAVRGGSVCLRLDGLPTGPGDDRTGEWDIPAELWPSIEWGTALAGSPLLTSDLAPIRRDGDRVYLARQWHEESRVLESLRVRLAPGPTREHPGLAHSLAKYFPAEIGDGPGTTDQRAAVEFAAGSPFTVITGGPGSGKTTSVAALLGVLFDQDPHLRVGLAAPTGKAAARMVEAIENSTARSGFPADHVDRIRALPAMTIHRLLRYSPHRGYVHNANAPLPYDVVVIDETSMVALPLMDRILQALAPTTALVLVGDPEQLASVEVGAVFSDIVEGLDASANSPIRRLGATWRFGPEIGELATAVAEGRAQDVLDLLARTGASGSPGSERVGLMDTRGLLEELLPVAGQVHTAAREGDAPAALDLLRTAQLMCAHRDGPHGVSTWNSRIAAGVAAEHGLVAADWYPGKPLLITRNDYTLGVFNGDHGVVVARGERLVVAFEEGASIREIPLAQLSDVAPAYAITVHRSQGSQFGSAYVLLPEEGSRILTRELFYTAITRAQERVRVIGSAEAIGQAVRERVTRASGLAERLRQRPGGPV